MGRGLGRRGDGDDRGEREGVGSPLGASATCVRKGGGGRDWEDGVMWQVLDPSRSLGMSGPSWGWIHASAHAKGALAASATGSGGGMTEGGGVDASMDCVYWAGGWPLPLDPSTLLRVSGPSWGWIHASAHAKGALAASSTGSGGGMTVRGVGLGLGHLGDAEVAGADLDAVYDPANLVIAELLEAKAV